MSTNSELIIIDNVKEKNNSRLWCQLCEYVLVTAEDSRCDQKHGCCEECWLSFGQMRQKEWKEGWHPDSETLNRYKQTRRIINIDIMKILGE